MLTVPNLLSLFRIILAGAFAVTYFTPGLKLISFIIFIVSGISDVLDGYIARKYNQISELGKILDPISDKLTQFTVLICFCISKLLSWWFVIILAARDIIMWIGGYIFYVKLKNKPIAAKWYGKLASFMFFVSIAVAYAIQYFEHGITAHGLIIIALSFLLTLVFSVFATVSYITAAVKANKERISLLDKSKKENCI